MTKQHVLGALLAGAMGMSVLLPPAPALARGQWAHAGQMRGGSHAGEHGPMMESMFERLNLSAEQRDKIKSLRRQGQERTKAQREQLNAKRQELHQLVRSVGASRDQAIAKQREVNALQNQLSEARMTSWFDMRAVLTPEQLAQLAQLDPRKRQRREKK